VVILDGQAVVVGALPVTAGVEFVARPSRSMRASAAAAIFSDSASPDAAQCKTSLLIS
jgi:hypothetical protein